MWLILSSAGDAYSAILCLGYLHGWAIEKINKLATRFAAEICTVDGAFRRRFFLCSLSKQISKELKFLFLLNRCFYFCRN